MKLLPLQVIEKLTLKMLPSILIHFCCHGNVITQTYIIFDKLSNQGPIKPYLKSTECLFYTKQRVFESLNKSSMLQIRCFGHHVFGPGKGVGVGENGITH